MGRGEGGAAEDGRPGPDSSLTTCHPASISPMKDERAQQRPPPRGTQMGPRCRIALLRTRAR